jgi:outer membrane protein assembly factor BamD
MRRGRFCDMFRPRMRTRLLLVGLLLPLLSCASSRTTLSGEMKYGKSAEEDYLAGVDELKHSNYIEAQKFQEHVRTKYPFSKYAALAELRLADAKFKQEKFIEAAEAYQAFVQLHPTHDEADYAEFRVALSHWRDAPSDFILLPPASEKDQKQLKAAAEKLRAFLKARPTSANRAEAERILAEAEDRLAAHEWYVAEFYFKREHWAGAAGRLEALLKDHPGSKKEPEAMLRLARTYLAMQETFRAQQALQRLVARYPDDLHRREAEALLGGLRK